MMMTFLVSTALAQQVTVVIDPDLAAKYGIDAEAVRTEAATMVNDQLRLPSQQTFLEEMAAANAMSSKGMGVDYASNPQRFVVGGSFGSSVNGVGASFLRGDGTLPNGGFAVQLSMMAGLNLGFASPDDSFLRRFVLTANGMALKGASGPFDASMNNFGAHLQLKLVRPPHKGVVEWGGLDLTAGYEMSHYHMILTKTLPLNASELTWAATGTFQVDTTSSTVPLELSTNLRLLVFTAFGGVGMDLRGVSSATTDLRLGGPLTVAVQGKKEELGTIDASLQSSGEASSYAPRVFGGVQINILPVKIYGQVNWGLLENSFGGHLGLRVAL